MFTIRRRNRSLVGRRHTICQKNMREGVRASRWVTMHGFALNVNVDMGYFDNIIPCGIKGKAVTSLNIELGIDKVDENEVKEKILKYFSVLFDCEFI